MFSPVRPRPSNDEWLVSVIAEGTVSRLTMRYPFVDISITNQMYVSSWDATYSINAVIYTRRGSVRRSFGVIEFSENYIYLIDYCRDSRQPARYSYSDPNFEGHIFQFVGQYGIDHCPLCKGNAGFNGDGMQQCLKCGYVHFIKPQGPFREHFD